MVDSTLLDEFCAVNPKREIPRVVDRFGAISPAVVKLVTGSYTGSSADAVVVVGKR